MKTLSFTPYTNQPCKVYEGDRCYYGSFTGSRYNDGSWQIIYKDSCGDRCYGSTETLTWSL